MSDATYRRNQAPAPGSPPGTADGGGHGPASARIAFLSTYPPSRCGIGSFTRSLSDALARLRAPELGLGVIRLMDQGAPPDEDRRVVARVHPEGAEWARIAAAAAARFDVLSVQHEYGIFGPDDGIGLLGVLQRVQGPVFTTLHTVPAQPSPRQRMILNELGARSDRLMVMSEVARERLLVGFRVEAEKVVVIPHGAPPVPVYSGPAGRRPIILSWGLIGPGKGIETAIRAMSDLRRLHPAPLYVVAGQTHPNVLRAQGEAYRHSLEKLARKAGVGHMVRFVPKYMDEATLGSYLSRADVVLLPYDSVEQVTSGVLVEAVAAGKPVVATAFPHAAELLATGAGLVVPQKDPAAMSGALARLLSEPGHAEAASVARRVGSQLLWPAVAARFDAEAQALAERQPARGR